MSGTKRMQHYVLETKLEAVRLFYEEGKTRAQITAQLGIVDASRVKKWLHQYRQGDVAVFTKKRSGPGRRPKKENKDAYIARLEMENELLKNSMPSCARVCSPSVISAHRTIPRKIPAEAAVCPVRDFAGCILCVG